MRLKSGKLPVKFPRTFQHRTMGWRFGFCRIGEWIVEKASGSSTSRPMQKRFNGVVPKNKKNDTF